MLRLFRLALSASVLVAALSSHAQPSDRVALVVGNSAYPGQPLLNPKNDARAMSNLLREAGFTVDQHLDTTQVQLTEAVRRFGTAIKDPKVKFALFYYAGHGLQQDWRNYLVPVSAAIRTAADVKNLTVDVSELLTYMEQAKGRSFLVILDACRDDPFAGAYRPPAKGLSQFDAPVGSLLAYATAPGTVARDGEGENGLYTSNLLREFAVRGARLEDAFKRVRLNVRMASDGTQVPWESTSLEEDVYLFPSLRGKLSDAEQDQQLELEISKWMRVRASNDHRQLAAYISEYPSGSASELAQSRLNRLLATQSREKAQRTEVVASIAPTQLYRDAQVRVEQATQQAQQAQAQQAAAQEAEERRLKEVALAVARQDAERAQVVEAALKQADATRLAEQLAHEARARDADLELQRIAAAQAVHEAELAKAEAERVAQSQRREALERQADAQARQLAERLAAQNAERVRGEAERLALAELEAQRLAASRLKAQQLAAVQEEAARRAQADQLAAAARDQQMERERRETALLQARQAEQSRLELTRLAAEREQATARLATEVAAASRVAPAPDHPAAAAPEPALESGTVFAATPFFQGYQEHRRSYQPGDQFDYKVIDLYTQVSRPLSMQVTAVDVDADKVEYNNGEYLSDTMGNTLANPRGGFSTPRQFYPAEMYVGKKWRTVFKQSRTGGTVYTFRYDMKVVGREKITVPAGTFDAFKIEARGFNMQLNARLERNIWVAPGVSGDIAHEIFVRLRNGAIEQNDRQELVSFKQPRQQTAAR